MSGDWIEENAPEVSKSPPAKPPILRGLEWYNALRATRTGEGLPPLTAEQLAARGPLLAEYRDASAARKAEIRVLLGGQDHHEHVSPPPPWVRAFVRAPRVPWSLKPASALASRVVSSAP